MRFPPWNENNLPYITAAYERGRIMSDFLKNALTRLHSRAKHGAQHAHPQRNEGNVCSNVRRTARYRATGAAHGRKERRNKSDDKDGGEEMVHPKAKRSEL